MIEIRKINIFGFNTHPYHVVLIQKQLPPKRRTDQGCWLLVTGYWLLVADCRLLVVNQTTYKKLNKSLLYILGLILKTNIPGPSPVSQSRQTKIHLDKAKWRGILFSFLKRAPAKNYVGDRLPLDYNVDRDSL